MNFKNLIFYLILIMSTLFSISSNSWLSCWMGMEINLFAFIPLLYNNNLNSESMIKYFIIQTLSSSIILLSIIMIMNNSNSMIFMIMNLAIFMKLGSVPFHYWYIKIIKTMNWKNCFILFTWQKIIPIILLNYNFSNYLIYFFTTLNILFGSLEGLNQISLRSIMNYSSINHLGWMLMIISINENLWLIYFYFYSLISLIMMIMFFMMNISFMNQLYSIKNNMMNTLNIMMNLLSLGGMPPLLGFFSKWISINYLLMNNELFMSLLLTSTSLISLYMYMRMSFSILILINYKSKWNFFLKSNYLNSFMFFISFISMMLLMISTMMMF